MKRSLHEKERGYTLVEAMVVVALSSMVFYGIFSVLRAGTIQANVASLKMTIQDSAREGLNRMLQEIRETSPSTINVTPATLSFRVAGATSSNGLVVWGDTITYSLNNGQLIRTSPADTRVIANNVLAINFTANSATAPTLVTVRMDVRRQTTQGRDYSETLIGQGKVRNEN